MRLWLGMAVHQKKNCDYARAVGTDFVVLVILVVLSASESERVYKYGLTSYGDKRKTIICVYDFH